MSDNQTPIIVSYSELDTFRQCPLKHKWAYRERWTRGVKTGSALEKGSLWHLVVETHYIVIKAAQDANGGKIPISERNAVLAEAWRRIVPIISDPVTGEQTETQELIEWMYRGYVERYGTNPRWRIVATEHQIITPLRDARGRRTRYHLKAKIDLIVFDRELGTRWVVDHKSCSDFPNYAALEMDDQFGLYCWALREMGKKHRVQGAIHSAARTRRNKGPMTLDQRFQHTPMSRGDDELDRLALDAYNAAWNAHPPASATTKIYSSPDPRQCGWKCDFQTVHLILRKTPQSEEKVLTEDGFRIDLRRH